MKVKDIPFIGPILSSLSSKLYRRSYFKNSGEYWEKDIKMVEIQVLDHIIN